MRSHQIKLEYCGDEYNIVKKVDKHQKLLRKFI